jgi:hypothetical protein
MEQGSREVEFTTTSFIPATEAPKPTIVTSKPMVTDPPVIGIVLGRATTVTIPT